MGARVKDSVKMIIVMGGVLLMVLWSVLLVVVSYNVGLVAAEQEQMPTSTQNKRRQGDPPFVYTRSLDK